MCKVCNLSYKFKSNSAIAFVCPECLCILHKGVTYNDNQPQTAFKVVEDLSPFQLGSKMMFEGIEYEFIGRYQFVFSNCIKNIWFLNANEGRELYLINQLGFYALCTKYAGVFKKSDYNYTMGAEFNFSGISPYYYLDCALHNTVARMEGELWGLKPNNHVFDAYDFSSNGGYYAFALQYGRMDNDLFTGKVFDFSNLKFLNTRF